MTHHVDPKHLRLLWPQWQGAGENDIAGLLTEVPLDEARRGYAAGTEVLQAVLPAHNGPTATVPVSMADPGTEVTDGIEAKGVLLEQLRGALTILEEHQPDRVTTIGGECSVSVAPFAYLAERYGEDLAVVWIDAHPDTGTPESEAPDYHAMALALVTGHGDSEFLDALPAVVPAEHSAIAGLHAWTKDDYPRIGEWGITTFAPNDLREDSQALLDWISSTGASKVAVHLDVDVVDGDEEIFGLGAEPQGLSSTQVRRLVDDLGAATDVVGLTVAEYIPRQVMQIRRLLSGMPLI